jgi:hypothetical protein
MLLKNQGQSFQVEVKSSVIQIYFIFITHALALYSCLIAAVPIVIKMVLPVGILAHLIFSWHQKEKLAGLKLQYSSAQAWQIAMGGNDFSPIVVLSSTVITPLVIFLHFKKQSGKKEAMLIFNDAICSEAFRKLTVELRINSLN